MLSKAQIITSLVIVASAAVIILLERLFPYNKGQKLLREGLFDDFVFYNGLQSFVMGFIISYIISFIDESSHLSRLHLISSWPVYLQVIFFLVIHDFYIYWFHRLQHSSRILWRIHEAHHSNKAIDWLAGARSHSLEILINQTIEFAPIVLLGAAPVVALYKGALSAIWGMYIHSNIDVHSGPLQYIINGPEMHRWHHSDGVPEAYNKNFSTKFAIWDWIFGTEYFPGNIKPQKFGLGDLKFPKNYFSQQLFAFRKFDDG
ncbi:MAG: sterol desaturase family protein [Ignavibacteriales bacterium]